MITVTCDRCGALLPSPQSSLRADAYLLCAPCRNIIGAQVIKEQLKRNELLTALKCALGAMEPIGRTGQVAQGGESNGNRIHIEYAIEKARVAIAKAEGKEP